jgi:hypothetical protein
MKAQYYKKVWVTTNTIKGLKKKPGETALAFGQRVSEAFAAKLEGEK